MAKLTYTESAKFAGISRATLYRHIKQGKVSHEQNQKGQNIIDTSELMRAYGEPEYHNTSSKASQQGAVKHDENSVLVPVLKQQIAFFESQLDDSKLREEKLFEMLEKEQEKTKVLMLEYHQEKVEVNQPKSEKLIYALVGLTMFVSFGAVAIIVWLLQNGA